jgi:allophanate hydrolase subunit 1
MTKVQLPFTLSVPLDGASLSRIADLYEIYGILRINAEPGERTLTVEYDATRFTPKEIAAVLTQAGIPLAPAKVA